jgi:ABC-type phosphate transport system substrate-binding protein
VAISPVLEPVREALHACAVSVPGIALFVDVVSEAAYDFNSSDLVLWWGHKPEEVNYAYKIAEDELFVIVNPNNINTEFTSSELRALFNGRIEHWTEFSIFEEQVSVWIYPQDSILSEVFKSAVLGDQRFSRLSNLAPSPGPMREEIDADPGAIGFIPQAWLSKDISTADIDPDLQTSLRRPVLALLNSEPGAGTGELLACLQTGDGQEILKEIYPLQSN